jgi:GNAT superfamily N-acetyltransferase
MNQGSHASISSADGAIEVRDAAGSVADRHEVRASCSLWWSETPRVDGHRLGLVGRYAASDPSAAGELLARACAELATRGCTLAVGPMDGSTWGRYRLLTERGDEPPFFLEPDNPDDWPAHFRDAGFEAIAEYVSTLVTDLGERDPRLGRVEARLAAEGVAIRPLRGYDVDAELGRIYGVSLRSFERNFLYTPIPEADFKAQYAAVVPYVSPDLVLIAEREDEPVGFVFALPDLARVRRGRPADTVVVKTLAVLPGRAYAGLGKLLLHRVYEAARRLGFTRAIHALMHEANGSRNLGNETERVIRRYTLFGKVLSGRRADAG